MEDVVEVVTAGHVTAVKIVLASVLLALAVYQALLMAVGYGKLRPPFLTPASASAAHRMVGDAVVALIGVLAVKLAVLHRWQRARGLSGRAAWIPPPGQQPSTSVRSMVQYVFRRSPLGGR